MPRIVYMGTPNFAAHILSEILDLNLVAVYSRPDAVSKRGTKTIPSPVSQLAIDSGILLHRPVTLRDPETIAELRTLAPDLIIVAAYGMILPKEVLEIPAAGCINIHASLLPRWRGAAPIERAILAGDKRTGVAIMQMEEGLDTGPYCAYEVTEVGEKSAAELRTELAEMGSSLLADYLPSILEGSAEWTIQDESEVSYADKIEKHELKLSPNLTTTDFVRRVRASSPSTPAKLSIADKPATVLSSSISARESEVNLPPQGKALAAKISGKRTVLLGCADGSVELLQVKPDGKNPMPAADWFNGFPKSPKGLTWH